MRGMMQEKPQHQYKQSSMKNYKRDSPAFQESRLVPNSGILITFTTGLKYLYYLVKRTMALVKSTSYAPDIYRALNGILLLYKPPKLNRADLDRELRGRISSSLNEFTPRPLSKRILIEGDIGTAKQIVEVPNLADHPLVVGPRYTPRELSLSHIAPLNYRSSGVVLYLLGSKANGKFGGLMKRTSFVNIYQLTGRFGHVTDNFFYDGKIQDKSTFKHIRSGKMDSVLSKIESNQNERLFDSANVLLDSQEAYELAKSWPSRPPKMANWPVIYRLRCVHLKLPEFKIEVTVCNETENFLAQLIHEVGLMLKSGAYTESIRRIKIGPFSVDESLTDREWDLQNIINHLYKNNQREEEILEIIRNHNRVMSIRTEYQQEAH